MKIGGKTLRLLQAIDSNHPSIRNARLAELSGLAPSGLPTLVWQLHREGYIGVFGKGPKRLVIVTPKGCAVLLEAGKAAA